MAWTPTHYYIANAHTVWVREARYFEELHGEFPEVLELWTPVYSCATVGQARRHVAEKLGVRLPWIYANEE